MTCAVTTSFLGCLVTIILFFRYIVFLNIPFSAKIIYLAVFLLMGCIPMFVSYKLENTLGAFYPVYRYALYFIFIGCIILFALTVCRDIVWLLGHKLFTPGIKQYIAENIKNINMLTIAIAIIITAFSLYAGIKTPDVKTITLATDKIKTPYTIAVLSDLHIHRTISPQKIKNIVSQTNAQKPDAILLAGDIIDDEVNKVSAVSVLLKGLNAPGGIYFVTGNHEFYAGYKETVKELKQLGFAFLENNGVALNNSIYAAGIPDLFSAPQHQLDINIQQAFVNAAPNQYRILVSHTPADFGPENNFDLEVSGHTHGGQIFPFHIFVKLANKYLAGLSEMKNNARIYVSRGAGQWGPQMRFLAPSEITIIKLQPLK